MVEAAPGIAVKVGQIEGYLVYELKVPLARTAETPYAIETRPGSAIGLGLVLLGLPAYLIFRRTSASA